MYGRLYLSWWNFIWIQSWQSLVSVSFSGSLSQIMKLFLMRKNYASFKLFLLIFYEKRLRRLQNNHRPVLLIILVIIKINQLLKYKISIISRGSKRWFSKIKLIEKIKSLWKFIMSWSNAFLMFSKFLSLDCNFFLMII